MAGRGRPRTFDRAAALRDAMTVFWEHGYDGAAMADLTRAMGINSPSLYAAFGSKEELFREAVALYEQTEGAAAMAALTAGPTARAAIVGALRANAVAYTEPDNPRGCMIVLAATTYTDRSQAVRDHLAERRRGMEGLFRARVERGIAEGDVPAGADAAGVAAFYNAVMQGMSVQARDGASRATLVAVAERADAAWDVVTG
ncbi:TetR/AcrR family transcriptional regulator [Actinophytocola glycyrrhizae]|uniref:TetR/AcrR family transcriptional regulator n=1 Tax=Actinophytocola glycyrrhizae TaxID=2044873 RepID=A0ABV9S7L4_9PSEU